MEGKVSGLSRAQVNLVLVAKKCFKCSGIPAVLKKWYHSTFSPRECVDSKMGECPNIFVDPWIVMTFPQHTTVISPVVF